MIAHLHIFQKKRAKRVLFERHEQVYFFNHITYMHILLTFQKERTKCEALRSFFLKLPQALEKYDDLVDDIKHMGSNANARGPFGLKLMCLMHTYTSFITGNMIG